jgi:hypothetical protein
MNTGAEELSGDLACFQQKQLLVPVTQEVLEAGPLKYVRAFTFGCAIASSKAA